MQKRRTLGWCDAVVVEEVAAGDLKLPGPRSSAALLGDPRDKRR